MFGAFFEENAKGQMWARESARVKAAYGAAVRGREILRGDHAGHRP
jgi:hypothetical protein